GTGWRWWRTVSKSPVTSSLVRLFPGAPYRARSLSRSPFGCLGVPLKSMCSRKCDIPVVPGTSLRPPTWYQTHSEMTGACRASSAYSTSPFSRRRVAGASIAVGMKKMVAARRVGGLAPEPCGKQRFHGDGRVDGPEHARALGVFVQDGDHGDRRL